MPIAHTVTACNHQIDSGLWHHCFAPSFLFVVFVPKNWWIENWSALHVASTYAVLATARDFSEATTRWAPLQHLPQGSYYKSQVGLLTRHNDIWQQLASPVDR